MSSAIPAVAGAGSSRATASDGLPSVSDVRLAAPWSHRRRWRRPATPADARRTRHELIPFLRSSHLPEDVLGDLLLAVCEAVANAVEHSRSEPPWFEVSADVGEGLARVVVQDNGRWREPTTGGGRGRGLLMMDVLAETAFTVSRRGTVVELRGRSPVRPDAGAHGGTR